MELKNLNLIETATQANRPELFRVGTALLFIICIMLFALMGPVEGIHGVLLVIAAMIGGYIISIGLALYGPKLIRTVGSEITELDQMRAFCIAMAAAITVIIASQIGFPDSSTDIAVGVVFGVGFLCEYLKSSYGGMVEEIKHHHQNEDKTKLNDFLDEFKIATLEKKKDMLLQLKTNSSKSGLSKEERNQLKKVYAQLLVKRSHFLKIAAAWVITVPASALMAALIYFMIRGIFTLRRCEPVQ